MKFWNDLNAWQRKHPVMSIIIALTIMIMLKFVLFPRYRNNVQTLTSSQTQQVEQSQKPQVQPRQQKQESPKQVTPEERALARVKNKVREYVNAHYNGTTIDNITVNPDLGTEKEDDYVALVRLTWNVKNGGKLSREMLDMYSSDMAARMYEDLPEVQELAVFWTVPYLNNGAAKISFERSNGGMRYTDKIYDRNFYEK